MTPNELHTALQKLTNADLPAAPDAHAIASKLIQRDQRRSVVLAAMSLTCWLIGTAGMLLLIIGLNRLVIFIRIADVPTNPPAASSSRSQPDIDRSQTPVSQRDERMLEGTSLIHHSLPLVAGSVAALLLAAGLTVLLIFSSRRATLNKINLSLAQIADQLKLLQESKEGVERMGSKSES